MVEGKHKVNGQLAYDDEEKNALTATDRWSANEKGDECESASTDDCDRVHRADLFSPALLHSETNDATMNQSRSRSRSLSNVIITGAHTTTISNYFNLIIATCSVNLATVAAGCVLSWSSPTIPKITTYGEQIQLNKDEASWLGSLVALGAILGPFVAGSLVNKVGRKRTILADMFLFLASWLILGYSNITYYLYMARILAGIAVGVVFTAVPMYIAEISPLHLKSILGSLLQLFLCFGFLISYIIGPYSLYVTLIVVSGVIPFLCILTFIWIPESPQYLLNKNQKQEAFESLQWLRGYPEKSATYSEISDILSNVDKFKHGEGTISLLLSDAGYLKALYYACALAFFQQLSGINIVLFYAETIFRATDSPLSPSVSTIIVALVMTASASLVAPAAKMFGVRCLLLFSAVGETFSLAGLGYYFYLKDSGQGVSALAWLPVTSLVCYIFTYSLGFGPFVWVFMAEIFPSHLKAIASSIVTSFCWGLCFILTRYFEVFITKFGSAAAFGVFSIICMVAFAFTFFQLPDIQGKSYIEVEQMLSGKKSLEYSAEKV